MNLYLVIREPRATAHNLRAILWHTHAKSAADAVRRFRELCGNEAGATPYYCAPRASLVSPGAIFYV